MAYDEKCEELALYFLADEEHTEDDVKEMAQAIQDTIEALLEDTELLSSANS